jgi:putative transposase
VTRLIAEVCPDGLSTQPYAPTHKPVVESFNSFIERRFCAALPGHTHGPTRADGKLYAREEAAITVPELTKRWGNFVRWVNYEHRSRSHAGQTRAQRFASLPWSFTPLNVATFRSFLPSRRLKVRWDGVHVGDRPFVNDALFEDVHGTSHGGEVVEVYSLNYGHERLFAAQGATWLGELVPRDEVSPEMADRMQRARASEHARMMTYRRRHVEWQAREAEEMLPTGKVGLAAPDLLGTLANSARPSSRDASYRDTLAALGISAPEDPMEDER